MNGTEQVALSCTRMLDNVVPVPAVPTLRHNASVHVGMLVVPGVALKAALHMFVDGH